MAPVLGGNLLILSIIYSIIALTAAHVSDSSGVVLRDLSTSHVPSLTAITVRSTLHKRGENFHPSHHCEHHYADHSAILSGSSSRFATTSMKYKWPAMALEDIEEDVEQIQCSESTITVQFTDQPSLDYAREAWAGFSKFLLISSHPGCSEDGERAPYLVSGIKYEPASLNAVFSVRRVAWKDAYENMTVKFSMSQGQYRPDALRFHDSLRRRQIPASSTVLYPAPPSSTPTTNVATQSINYQAPADQQIFTYSQSQGNTASIGDSISVNCKDCSIDGSIEITEGEFTVIDSVTAAFQAKDFITNGYFKAVFNGMKAHVELDTTLSLSTGIQFDQTLTTIGLPGFQIPGIAAIGPIFQPHIKSSLEIAAQLGFGYGFDLTVPDNSSIILNIGNITQSSSSGFNDASITALPLTATSPEFSLTLGVALVAELLLGIDILNGAGGMDAGFFLNLPSLSTTITQLSSVNAECEPISNITTVDEFLSHIFPNLTNIVPEVGVGVGLQIGAHLNVVEANVHESIGTSTTLAGTQWTMPTACLSYDVNRKAFTSPTVSSTAAAAATGESGTLGGKKSSAGERGRQNPISGGNGVWWSAGMFLSVLFVAVSL